jgi:hypothetical protein
VCDECGKAFAAEDSHVHMHGAGVNAAVVHRHRRRVFSLSLGDWLEGEPLGWSYGKAGGTPGQPYPTGGIPIEWLARMLDTIRQCDKLTWILCTKRPENFHTRMHEVSDLWSTAVLDRKFGVWDSAGAALNWLEEWLAGNPPPNVWILASAENQDMADRRVPDLLKIPAAKRGLSLEPLLGPVNILGTHYGLGGPRYANSIYRLIIGGESGPRARPCNVEWIRSLIRQGKEAGVATFVKQLGSRPCVMAPDATDTLYAVPWHLKHPKGADPSEWPADLRVREWPG